MSNDGSRRRGGCWRQARPLTRSHRQSFSTPLRMCFDQDPVSNPVLLKSTISGPAPAALVAFFAALAVLTCVAKLWRLVIDSGPHSALVISFLHPVAREWWEGSAIYAEHIGGVTYPPATWFLLGGVFGWTSLDVARWIWAGMVITALTGLGIACSRGVRDSGPFGRACAFLAPFSMPAIGDAIGIGAVITVLLPLAVGAVLLAARDHPTRRSDLAAAGMFDVALSDPSLALPFFGPLLAAPRRIRPAALAIAGYAILTTAAALIHPGSLMTDLSLALNHIQGQAGVGYGNLQDWLFRIGQPDAFLPASLILLGLVYGFSWWCRRCDIWLLLGVSALAARLWMAPRIAIDALLIIPLIAMVRVWSRQAISAPTASCGTALIASVLVLWVPLHFHHVGSDLGPLVVGPSWVRLFNSSHTAVFLLMLAVLTASAVLTRRAVSHGSRGHAEVKRVRDLLSAGAFARSHLANERFVDSARDQMPSTLGPNSRRNLAAK
jgi:hypothetical protein